MMELTKGELINIRETLSLCDEELRSVADTCELLVTSEVFDAIRESLEIIDGLFDVALRQQLQELEEELNEETHSNS